MIIIITTYHERENDSRFINRRKYLDKTIKSIDHQNKDDIFHILVDDGSDQKIFNHLSEKYNVIDKRLVLRREKKPNEPLTSTNARNFAIRFCLSNNLLNVNNDDYITFIDSDDILINFNKRTDFMYKEKPDFLYTDSLLFFNNNDVQYTWVGINPKKAYNVFWIKGKMPYTTMTWKVSFLRKLIKYIYKKYNFNGPFDPKIGCGEDVDIALSSFECAHNNNLKISYLPTITAGYRIHEHSLATIRDQAKRKNEEKSIIRRHFGSKTNMFYIKRFITRPECTLSIFMKFKNIFRKQNNQTIINH